MSPLRAPQAGPEATEGLSVTWGSEPGLHLQVPAGLHSNSLGLFPETRGKVLVPVGEGEGS